MTQVFRLARSMIIAGLVVASLRPVKALDRGPAGFYFVAADDCGNPAREGHLITGQNGEVPVASATGSSREERTYSKGSAVVYRYSGLPSSARYKLRIIYLSDSGGRIVRLSAGGVQLDGPFKEPERKPARREIDVPRAAIQNGVLELRFEKVGEKDAVVNEIELWSTARKIASNLFLTSAGNSRGEITGEVTNWLYQPVRRCSIHVDYGAAREHLSGTTGVSGRFSVHAPSAWRSLAPGLVGVRASHEGFVAVSQIGSYEIYPPDIRLTPRPTMISRVKTLRMDLDGTWKFAVQPPPKFWMEGALPAEQIHHIQVPGERAMEGFSVPQNGAAGYWRTFEVPAEWVGKQIKLRCDAVFSLAEVWVNGKKIGQYEGGFTPFEFDVTKNIEPGKASTIALRVEEDTTAAKLSAMIPYAQHELGGITRRIYLFAVPEVNIFRFQTETQFDDHFRNATLRMTLGVANQSGSTVVGGELRFHFTDPNGNPVSLSPAWARVPVLRAGEERTLSIDIPVMRPLHWENEHPRLYTLMADLVVGGSAIETVGRRVGFRQVEIRGNRFLLNGHAIKLHGVERHETNPILGRAQRSDISYKREVQLLKEANVNWVFTSHYPVPEEFLDLCDERGLLVTEEAPSVWVGQPGATAPHGNRDPRYYNTMATIAATMLERDRNHPSVIFWQACDECAWGRNFGSLLSLFHVVDPTRPVNFSYEATDSDFFSQHYPSIEDARKVPATGGRPVVYDQYAHINNYNRREILTDPGLRDYYGREIAPMWNVMYSNPGILGGAIWEWSDDIFYVPPSGFDRARFHGYLDSRIGRWKVGYGPWGIIDSWLRTKPEFWNVKKAYSPVRIHEHASIPSPVGGLLRIPVENRYDFTNLNELRMEWRAGKWQGLATANIPPRSKGVIEVRLPEGATDIHGLTLKIFDKGELVDAYNLTVDTGKVEEKRERTTKIQQEPAPQLEQTVDSILVRGHDFYWEFDRRTGLIVAGARRLSASILGGPYLSVTPLETVSCCSQIAGPVVPLQPPIMPWTPSSVTARREGTSVLIQITGHYSQYQGGYTIRVHASGDISVHYQFEYNGPDLATREVGLAFNIPADLNVLRWKHLAQWSYYPAGHIGRPLGVAHAFRNVSVWPKSALDQAPPWPWDLDETAGGTNDFRSTKYHIVWASLTGAKGGGMKVVSDGLQNVRVWFDQNLIRLLVTDFANGGGEPLSSWPTAGGEHKTLRKGDVISGTVRLEFIGSLP